MEIVACLFAYIKFRCLASKVSQKRSLKANGTKVSDGNKVPIKQLLATLTSLGLC